MGNELLIHVVLVVPRIIVALNTKAVAMLRRYGDYILSAGLLESALEMIELMLDLNLNLDTALVIVTHDLEIADRMRYHWHMQDGILEVSP